MQDATQNIENNDYSKADETERTDDNAYVRSLETAVKLLQTRLDELINKSGSSIPPPVPNEVPELEEIKFLINNLSTATDQNVVYSSVHNELAKSFHAIESNIYKYNGDSLRAFINSVSSPTLAETISRFEGDGITDWLFEKKTPALIPDYSFDEETGQLYILLIPLISNNAPYGLIAAKTGVQLSEVQLQANHILSILSACIVPVLENLEKKHAVLELENRINAITWELYSAAGKSLLGILTDTLSRETINIIKVIKANLKFIESGLGDTKRRLEIIEGQLDSVEVLHQHLSEISARDYSIESSASFNIILLIEEILVLTGIQMQSYGIKIEKEFAKDKINISGYKSRIELALINILLFATETMPDGGIIRIGIFPAKDNKTVSITFSDTGTGIENIYIPAFLDSFKGCKYHDYTFRTGLKLANDLIKYQSGDLRIVSEVGNGTTYRIIFPLVSQ